MGKIIACALIIAAVVVSLGVGIHDEVGLQATLLRHGAVRRAVETDGQEQCLYRAIRAEVPKGAKVYVIVPNAETSDLLTELSTNWAVPQQDLAAAHWRLWLHVFHGPKRRYFESLRNVRYAYCGGRSVLLVRPT